MRGLDEETASLFSDVSCEARVPPDHPLRLIRAVVDEALDVLSTEFDGLYARHGPVDCAGEAAAGIAAAGLLLDPLRAAVDGATRLQPAVPLVRRFGDGRAGVGREHLQQEPRAASSKNRERLLAGDVAQKLLAAVVGQPRVRALTPPGRPGLGMTDPDARLARKSDGQSSILAYAGHVLMGRAEP